MKVPQPIPSRTTTTKSVNNSGADEGSTGINNGNSDSRLRSSNAENPAFLGASHAYRPQRPASIRSVSTSSITSEGTAGAASISRQPTPDDLTGGHSPAGSGSTVTTSARALPAPPSLPQSRSPSHHAALVAAARAGMMQAQQQTSRTVNNSISPSSVKSRPTSLRLSSSSVPSIDNDTSSIPPTTSLVNLFERKASSTAIGNAVQDKSSTSGRRAFSPPLQSPKPRRQNGSVELLEVEAGSGERSDGWKAQSQGVVQLEDSSKGRPYNIHAEQRPMPGKRYSQSISASGSSSRAPTISASIHDDSLGNIASSASAATTTTSSNIRPGSRPPTVGADAIEEHDFAIGSRTEAVDGEPLMKTSSPSSLSPPIVPRRSQQQPLTRAQTSSVDIKPRPQVMSSTASSQSIPAAYRQAYPKQTTKLNTDNELANAIVASSLASSRLVALQKRERSSSSHSAPGFLPASVQQQQSQPPPPPLSRRQSRRHIFHHNSRTPSPVKLSGGVLRQTLRKPQDTTDSEEEDDTHPYGKHHKKRLIRKHPNKHHEGDRKRWRDAVTDAERKRYEGVWAANKGLHILPMPRDSDQRVDGDALVDQVSNVVVKDIWARSRLPDFELEAVWDLVDTEGIGRLNKEEFVVGLWLIDQRLKGRKLPVKVTPTVWASVRGLQGIKIRRHQ